jgi:hypothetical protein
MTVLETRLSTSDRSPQRIDVTASATRGSRWLAHAAKIGCCVNRSTVAAHD